MNTWWKSSLSLKLKIQSNQLCPFSAHVLHSKLTGNITCPDWPDVVGDPHFHIWWNPTLVITLTPPSVQWSTLVVASCGKLPFASWLLVLKVQGDGARILIQAAMYCRKLNKLLFFSWADIFLSLNVWIFLNVMNMKRFGCKKKIKINQWHHFRGNATCCPDSG